MPLTDSIGEIIHGTAIRDPYRWLEDRDLPETEDWIAAQQRHSEWYFRSRPDLGVIERRVRHSDVEALDQPACVRDQYFYRKRPQGQEQGQICMRGTSGGSERVLIDPSRDGRFASVSIHRISSDAAFLAYEGKRGGGDQKEIRFLDVNTGTILPNMIPLGYARGLAFSQTGYYYCREIDENGGEHGYAMSPSVPSDESVSLLFPENNRQPAGSEKQ